MFNNNIKDVKLTLVCTKLGIFQRKIVQYKNSREAKMWPILSFYGGSTLIYVQTLAFVIKIYN